MEVMNCSRVGSRGFLEEKSWESPCGGVDGGVGGRAGELCSHLMTLPALIDRYAIISLVTGRRTNSSRAALRVMGDIAIVDILCHVWLAKY